MSTLTLNTNVSSLNTQYYLNKTSSTMSTSLTQLSSGLKINSSADDPAGYAIAYSLSVKAASLSTAINNGNQAVAMLQTAQSGMQEVADILTQLNQIATEAASSTTDSTNLGALDNQVTQLLGAINNIANNTKYGAVSLLTGSVTFTFQVGSSNATDGQISVSLTTACTTTGLSLSGGVSTLTAAQTFMNTVDTAISTLNNMQGVLGANINKIEYQISNLQSMYDNTMSSVSTIRDTDYASAMSTYSNSSVSVQAGVAMLSQANQAPQLILSLIKNA
jgi:flagellin